MFSGYNQYLKVESSSLISFKNGVTVYVLRDKNQHVGYLNLFLYSTFKSNLDTLKQPYCTSFWNIAFIIQGDHQIYC